MVCPALFLELFSAFSGLHIIIEEFHHGVKINSEEFHQIPSGIHVAVSA